MLDSRNHTKFITLSQLHLTKLNQSYDNHVTINQCRVTSSSDTKIDTDGSILAHVNVFIFSINFLQIPFLCVQFTALSSLGTAINKQKGRKGGGGHLTTKMRSRAYETDLKVYLTIIPFTKHSCLI